VSSGPFAGPDVREEIVARSRTGARLTEIERELIDPVQGDEDEKAALWLLAWSVAGRAAPGSRSPRPGTLL